MQGLSRFEQDTEAKADYIVVEMARLILSNSERAALLIQSFKQVAVDQTSEERRRFNLAEYVGEILTSLQPTLKKTPHQTIVNCPPDLEMESYPGALSHVLTNLVVNALIHGLDNNKPGTIRISARLENDQVLLTFFDDGCGIPAEHLGRIFEPFFTTKRGDGGSGLGLNVVYNSITTTLQGNIVCDSSPGCGTTFTMRIPVSVANTPTKGQ